jgi:SAM-dependent methyltransferase
MSPELLHRMAENQQQHWWFSARREIIASVLSSLPGDPRKDILEIGCGTGGNLAMLSTFGNVSAMECDEFSIEHALSLGNWDIRRGWLPDGVPFERTFDLICLFDVLEHVQDDQEAMRAICSLVRPGGWVVLTTPAYKWLYGEHDREHGHYRRYTAGRIVEIAREAGFNVPRAGYFNTLLFPLVAIRRLMGKWFGYSTGSDTEMPSPLLNRLLRRVFAMERFVLGKGSFPFGTSVIAILKRPE